MSGAGAIFRIPVRQRTGGAMPALLCPPAAAGDARPRRRSLLALALRERWCRAASARIPEPEAMVEAGGVAAFDAMGDDALRPVYLLAIARLSALVPPGGRVLDLGCGSARFLCAFLAARPDCRGIGLDLSPAMLARAAANARAAGVDARAAFVQGDMADPSAGPPIAAAVCLFALHHLPDAGALARTLAALAALQRDQGCALWLFDHQRPRHPATAGDFPAAATPRAPGAFQRDSAASLAAAWSAGELDAALRAAGVPAGARRSARLLPLYQEVALPGRQAGAPPPLALWRDDRAAWRRARLLGWLMGGG